MEEKMRGEGRPQLSEEEVKQRNQEAQERMTPREKTMTSYVERPLSGEGWLLKLEDRIAARALRERKTVAEIKEIREKEIREMQEKVKSSISAIPDAGARGAVQNYLDKLLPYFDFLNKNAIPDDPEGREEWEEKARPFLEPVWEAQEAVEKYKGNKPYGTNPEVWAAGDMIGRYWQVVCAE